VILLLKYHQNPQGTKYRKKIKKRENVLKKEKKKRKKKKSSKSLSKIKGKSIFSEEKNTSTSKSSF
jgi:hypothetical protein